MMQAHTPRTFVLVAMALLFASIGWAQFDIDGDGMSDIWQSKTGARDLDPQADTDGDGVINLFESIMGTNPRQASSVLRADIRHGVDGRSRITFPGVAGKAYQLRVFPDLRQDGWVSPDIVFGGMDESPVSLEITDNQLTAVSGVLLREHWAFTPLSFDAVKWDAEPDGVFWTNQLGQPSQNAGRLEGTAQQISGWLSAPKDGRYNLRFQFSVASRSQFYLSPDHDPANAVVVAEQFSTATEGSTDIPVDLVAGKPVFVRLRHENGGLSGARLSRVLWQAPGAAEFVEIPASALSLALPEALPILDGDVNHWTADIAVSDLDSDGDQVTDAEEILASKNPYQAGTDEFDGDFEAIALQFSLFETVYIRVVEVDSIVPSTTSREGEAKHLRVIGLIPKDRTRRAQEIQLTVHLGGSATLGEDYLLPGPPTLHFQSTSQDWASFDLIVLNDELVEDDETIEFSSQQTGFHIPPVKYIIHDDDRPFLRLEVPQAVATESPRRTGRFRVTRGGNLSQALSLNVTQSGSALEGIDYQPLPLTFTIPAGRAGLEIPVTPLADAVAEEPETVTLRLGPTPGYDLAPHRIEASVTIVDEPLSQAGLYVATYGPEGDAATDAWGYATLQLAEDRQSAVINTRFANLTSPQTTAHIHEGAEGQSGPVVEGLDTGEVSDHLWSFGGAADDILQALNNGRLYANVHSVRYPDGEIRGNFYPVDGSDVFTPPPDLPRDAGAPGLPLPEAFDFLHTATMGPLEQEAVRVRQIGVAAWLDEQMALPETDRSAISMAFDAKTEQPNPNNRMDHSAWLTSQTYAADQLRRRLIHALGQIFVVSRDDSMVLYYRHIGFADYEDMLGRNAFGNFRDLLHDIARHPVMGNYLSHIQNPKADPVRGVYPDENFAREIMQLFSIGLFELHPDGTLRLDPVSGSPIPTYGTPEISELARVFTGFGYATDFRNSKLPGRENRSFYGGGGWTQESGEEAGQLDWVTPMKLFPEFHDAEPKRIIGDIQLVGLDGEAELDAVIDSLFHHPNTGPFIATRLIKRLTTANPSPGYVYRVARAFAENGAGVRGDMAAVVRAIYLDPEVRGPASPSRGKFREPLLMITQLNRIFEFENRETTLADLAAFGDIGDLDPTAKARFLDFRDPESFVQRPFYSPTVFNYFDPDYIPVGPLGQARLTNPEDSHLGPVNLFELLIFLSEFPDKGNQSDDHYYPENPRFKTRPPILPSFGTGEEIVDDLNRRLFGDGMSPLLESTLLQLMQDLSASNPIARYKAAMRVALLSPEFLTQR